MISALSMSRRVRCYALVGALVLLTACSVLPKAETLTVYQLAAPSIKASAHSGSLPWSLRIARPYSSQVIDSVRVLVLPEPNQVSAYSGARWSDPAPVLLRDQLAGTFRADGMLASVSTDASDVQADFELGGDLIAFQVEYENGAPVVHIRYDAALTQVARNRIAATRSFEVRQPVQGKDVPEVVAAFGAAAGALSTEIRLWVMERGASLARKGTQPMRR